MSYAHPQRSGTVWPLPVALAAWALAACSPKPVPAPPTAPPVAAPAPPIASPAPAHHAHMVCRSSRDGRPIACGTTDAVMVGIKED